jgi:hypothetical protein
MNKDKMGSYNEKMRSQYASGNYRSAQRTGNSFFAELIGDGVNAIGGFFRDRREAKERERERLEQLRREREAAERRIKITKIVLLIVLFLAVITGIIFVIINGSILQNIGTFFSGIFEAIKDFLSVAGGFFKNLFNHIVDFCSNIFSKVVNFVKTLWPFGKN